MVTVEVVERVNASRADESRDAALKIQIAAEMDWERVRREARRRLDAEERGPVTLPESVTLRERLARPRQAPSYRLERWKPRHSRVMLAAQFKTGKTTLVGNYLRCVVDGDDWLGRYPVTPIDGRVALLDFEMSQGQLDDWLGAQHIRASDRIVVTSMRGQAAAFNPLDRTNAAEWAARFREQGVEDLVLDCLRPVLDALGLDEHRDAGRFLVPFDALLKAAQIDDALIVQHMGHIGERSRGDSRLRDWPDVEWRLVRQDENPASARYLSAYGRDVDVPESQLAYDPALRRLTLVGGSRQDAKTGRVLDAVIEALQATSERLTGRGIKDAMRHTEHGKDAIDAALREGVRQRRLSVEEGPRRSHLYQVSGSVRAVSAEQSEERVSECPSAFIEGGHTGHSATVFREVKKESVSDSDPREGNDFRPRP
jgi:hypothetical protein